MLLVLWTPLWLCAMGVGALVYRGRVLMHRDGNIPVRILRPDHTRWTRGNALWVDNVVAWPSSPAAWTEDLVPVESVQERPATAEEHKPLHRLGLDPALAVLPSHDGTTLTAACAAEQRQALPGRFAADPVA